MANRYSNYTPSAYTPLTLEEIALVPAMKRKQHDELLAKQELIRSGLAKVDPYKKHFDEAVNLKQGIEGKMDTMASQLASQGIDNDMIGKTIGLNREYQDLIAPTGKLGQINAEKINIAKINDDYDKMAASQKWSPAEADYWKSKAIEEYNAKPIYDESGQLLKYTGPVSAPTRVDYSKKMDDYASKAKMSTSEFAKAAQQIASDVGEGQQAVVGSSYSKKFGSNAQRVVDAYNTMKREMSDPTSDVYKSMQYERRNPKDLLNTMYNQSQIYKQTMQGEERGNTINPFGSGKESDLGGGTIISNDSTLTSDATALENYTSANKTIKQLESAKSLNPADRTKLNDLKELQKDADTKLAGNKDYLNLNTKVNNELGRWQRLAGKMNLSPQEQAEAKANPGIIPQMLFSKGIGSFKGTTNDPDMKMIMSDKEISNFNNLSSQRQKIKDEAWTKSSSMRHNYSYMPSTPKEESVWNLHNENVHNVLKGIPSLGDVVDLTSINTTGGTRKDLNAKDVSNVQNLIKAGDPKTFKISNIKTYGDNRTPEITMTFNTTKGTSEYDVEGSNDWSDEYGGEEKPVTVTFKMKRFSNAADTGSAIGYKNLSGAIADFWKTKGGVNQMTGNFQGAEVSNSLIENAYGDLSDQQLKARAQVDSDAREALYIRTAKHQAKKGK